MPLRLGNVFCVNHTTTSMQTSNEFNALTKVSKSGSNISFHPDNGIPVRVFVCPECGYIEIYHAPKTPGWE